MLNHVLVPLDGSGIAEHAVDYARRILPENGRLTLLTVVDVPDYPSSMFYPAGIPTMETSHEVVDRELVPQAENYLRRRAKDLQEIGFETTIAVEIGEPALTIVKQANEKEVSAIVMSTHGRTGISRWLFGSVARKVLSISHRPVFVVPVHRIVAAEA